MKKEHNCICLNIKETQGNANLFQTMHFKRRTAKATQKELEIAPGSIWKPKTYVTRRKRFGTVVVRFATEDEPGQHSREPLKSDEGMLMPKYLVRRVTKLRISEIPPE